MRIKSLLAVFFGVALVFAVAIGCSAASDLETETVELKIGSLTIEDNLPLLVAQQNGYFTEEKLEFELLTFQSPVELQSTFQSGALDGMITDMPIAAMLKSSGQNLKITSLTLGATPQEGRFAILASPESKISTAADLKGKSIGISSNSIIEYVTDGLLAEAGIDPSAVNKTVVAKIPVRLEMLLNNQIDAITIPDPMVSYAVSRGAKIIAEDTQGANLSQAVILINGKALDNKKDAVKRFYRAYAKAVDDINASPDNYKEILIKNVNIPEDIKETYKVQHYSKPQLPNQKEVDNIITWLQNKGLLKNEITYESLIEKGLY